MKKQILGVVVLLAALVMTGCGNKNQKKENTNEQTTTEVKEEKHHQMLIIVDPQIDFTHSRFSGLYQKKKRCWASFSSLVLAQNTGSKV